AGASFRGAAERGLESASASSGPAALAEGQVEDRALVSATCDADTGAELGGRTVANETSVAEPTARTTWALACRKPSRCRSCVVMFGLFLMSGVMAGPLPSSTFGRKQVLAIGTLSIPGAMPGTTREHGKSLLTLPVPASTLTCTGPTLSRGDRV